ncbi:MAG TPA: thioredoxin-dependent thiol peroxidase [Chloroflexota bacterium]|nr:thioredoxin-dependent thiol peroxidase [Chloroflexota bacterium]
MAFLRQGDIAPDFTLPSSGGGTLTLSELRGRPVILYFYPKDDTSGCTKQACDLRDAYPAIQGTVAVVVGVSPDSVASHDRFITKYGLPFTLLSDVDHRVAEMYGAWGEKSMYGKKYMGIQRSTYLIGPDGRIERVWEKVKAPEHAGDVLAALGARS